MIKVKNVTNANGRAVPNQFIITTPDGDYFQSYDSVIAHKSPNGHVTLDTNKWDYSNTTGKYRNMFLNEKKADTLRKIASGTYQLANLN